MYGVENMLSSLPFRGFLIVSGLFGIAFFGAISGLTVARSFGRGRKLHVDRTPFPRTMFQLGVAGTLVGFLAAFMGFMGTRFIGVLWDAFGVGILVAILLWVWHWVEDEFAWPGWFVPAEAKDIPGRFYVRREARRREKAELLALGREMVERDREDSERGDKFEERGDDGLGSSRGE